MHSAFKIYCRWPWFEKSSAKGTSAFFQILAFLQEKKFAASQNNAFKYQFLCYCYKYLMAKSS